MTSSIPFPRVESREVDRKLEGCKLRYTAFEQGYKAAIDGLNREENPYDAESSPFSRKQWDSGWLKARKK